jgi:hypothetical protein
VEVFARDAEAGGKMSDEEWLDGLDRIGAAATRAEFWEHLAKASQPWNHDAADLYRYLIDSAAASDTARGASES